MASSAITRMSDILSSRPTASSETPPEVRSLGQKVGRSPGLIWLRVSWFVTLADLFLCNLTVGQFCAMTTCIFVFMLLLFCFFYMQTFTFGAAVTG